MINDQIFEALAATVGAGAAKCVCLVLVWNGKLILLSTSVQPNPVLALSGNRLTLKEFAL